MKSRLFCCLPIALVVLGAGCATSDAPKPAQKHVHSPWRYKHMNHTHTRPWNKETKPPKPCEVAAKTR